MSKLFKLKKWLTLDEAATHISTVLGESVTVADIYKFGLDGHLVLSASFVNIVKAKKITFIKKEDIKYQKVFPKGISNIQEGEYINAPINAKYPISKDYWLESIEDKVVSLSGVWDLSMLGAEKFTIKQLYQQEVSSGVEVKMPEVMSVFVKGVDETYQLQLLLTMAQFRERHKEQSEIEGAGEKKLMPRITESARAYPASRLDELDYDLVVKVKEITRFIQSLEDAPQEAKPLMPRERNTLLSVIEALLKKQGIDPSGKGVTSAIALTLEEQGVYLSDNTIRKITRQITDITA